MEESENDINAINIKTENNNNEIIVNNNISEEISKEKNTNEKDINNLNTSHSTDIIEYKEIEEPCVALTIIGENKLTNTEVFIKRGVKFSIKAFFSGIILTIMNLFI